MKLSVTKIKNTKPCDKQITLSDGNGLYLRVKPTGTKGWIFRYTKPSTKKVTQMGMGGFPSVSLVEARERAFAYKKLLSNGLDPQIEKVKNKAQKEFEQKNTLRAVAEDWYLTQTHIAPNTLRDKKSKLRLYVFPDLGNLPIADITAPLAKMALDRLAKQGKFSVLHRTIQILNAVMNHALIIGAVTHNPTISLGKAYKAHKPQNRATLRPEELPLLVQTMNRANITYLTRLLFEFQLHTMVRPSEAVTAKWSEIDFDEELWIIPAEKMKMRREHKIPLSPHVLAILQKAMLFNSFNGYIFPSRTAKAGHVSSETLLNSIKRTSLKRKQTAHGLRALASTTLNEQGFDADIIEKALAHSDNNQIRATYNHAEYLGRRRKMMCWWSEHIEQAAYGNLSATGTRNLKAV